MSPSQQARVSMAAHRGQRPERLAAAEKFYNAAEVARYQRSERMRKTQEHLAKRALQLLALPQNAPPPVAASRCPPEDGTGSQQEHTAKRGGALLLDLGCGSGYSGSVLERAGHTWIGVDISLSMLQAARKPSAPRDLLAADIGCRLGLRKRIFDGAISISAVQWLCFVTKPDDKPEKRVSQFFRGLCAVLCPGARAVLQLYPEQPEHMGMLRKAALAAGFSGGLCIDYPRSERSKKLFLVLISPLSGPPTTSPRPALAEKAGRKGRKGRPAASDTPGSGLGRSRKGIHKPHKASAHANAGAGRSGKGAKRGRTNN